MRAAAGTITPSLPQFSTNTSLPLLQRIAGGLWKVPPFLIDKNLASGRFAMLENKLGFALVPWRSVIERSLGRTVTAVLLGSNVSWHLGRQRGIAI